MISPPATANIYPSVYRFISGVHKEIMTFEWVSLLNSYLLLLLAISHFLLPISPIKTCIYYHFNPFTLRKRWLPIRSLAKRANWKRFWRCPSRFWPAPGTSTWKAWLNTQTRFMWWVTLQEILITCLAATASAPQNQTTSMMITGSL